jgi:hypothetical protein
MNFFERMERKINFHEEYYKLDYLILNSSHKGHKSINKSISENFRYWPDRKNFLTFEELREYLGYTYNVEYDFTGEEYFPTGRISGISDFMAYCEMIMNLTHSIDISNKEDLYAIQETMKYDLDQLNYEFKQFDDRRILAIQKDAGATAVANIVQPKLADAIMEYNHYLLRGNLDAKRTILKKIADGLEPKRNTLKEIVPRIERDFFYLVNTMNIRHNNCDPADTNKYQPVFAALSDQEKEKWYDEIYQEALMAFMSLQQPDREKKIADFKQTNNK